MKKLAKLFLLVLVFALMASVLVACGEDKTTTDEPTHVHAFDEWKVVTNPTCTTKGLKKRTCKCGEEETEEIEALGHNYVNGVCSRCGLKELKETEGLVFELQEDDTYAVTGYTGSDKEVVILSTHDGKAVTSIGIGAFYDCNSLTSITIPDSVTSIGDDAFYNCSSLTSITIPDSVTSIEYGAFSGCSKLTSITIPDSVTSIGSYAFSDCSKLTSITIPDSVTSIGYDAFCDCISLKSITIPDSVTSIGRSAFENCSSLRYNEYDNGYYLGNDNNPYLWLIKAKNTSITSCTIHEDTKFIYSSAFSGCSSLQYNEYDNGYYLGNDNNPYIILVKAKGTSITSCTIHENTKFIYGSAFSSCSGLTSITIPDSVTSIGDGAFSSCSSLTSITIPDSVTSIGGGAFYNCSNLTSITLGNSVTSIGSEAFSSCSSLTSVYYTGDIASWCGITFSGHSSNPLGYAHNLYINKELIKDIVIPDTVTKIKASTFHGWNGTSIMIPDSVTSIGSNAFYKCDSLTSVYYTGDIASWCGITFDYSNPLEYAHNLYIDNELIKEIIIPDTVTKIKDYAFHGWNGTSITIPDSVTSIGSGAFSNCSNLQYNKYNNGYYLGNDNNPCLWLIEAKNTSITSCKIYEDTKFIYSGAFSGCISLKSITIPDSVTSIGERAFSGCSSLTSITIPDSVTSIGEYAFRGCSSLTSITIPNSVTSIGVCAFRGCDSLTSITFQGMKAQWNAISKGRDWNYSTGNYTVHCTDGDITE